MPAVSVKVLLTSEEMDRALKRMAHEILEKNPGGELPSIVGIRTRGEHLAGRLVSHIQSILQSFGRNETPHLGILDINLYRDDLTRVSEQPVVRETIMNFEIDDKTVILVDDVLYTGRTTRAALDALMDFGRPKKIQCAVLIDRGHRELPIRADYVGKNVPTHQEDSVYVHMKEVDGKDEVVLSEGVKK